MSDTMSTSHFLLIGGEMVEFPRLTVKQIDQCCQAVLAGREANARKLALEMKLSPNELFNVLFEIQTRGVSGEELLAMRGNPSVAMDVVRRSVNDDAKFAAMVDKISLPDITELCKALILELEPEKATPTDKDAKEAATNSPLDGGNGASTPPFANPPAKPDSISTTETVATGKGNIQVPAGYGSIP